MKSIESDRFRFHTSHLAAAVAMVLTHFSAPSTFALTITVNNASNIINSNLSGAATSLRS